MLKRISLVWFILFFFVLASVSFCFIAADSFAQEEDPEEEEEPVQARPNPLEIFTKDKSQGSTMNTAPTSQGSSQVQSNPLDVFTKGRSQASTTKAAPVSTETQQGSTSWDPTDIMPSMGSELKVEDSQGPGGSNINIDPGNGPGGNQITTEAVGGSVSLDPTKTGTNMPIDPYGKEAAPVSSEAQKGSAEWDPTDKGVNMPPDPLKTTGKSGKVLKSEVNMPIDPYDASTKSGQVMAPNANAGNLSVEHPAALNAGNMPVKNMPAKMNH